MAPWLVVAALAVADDLLSSFVKRRMGLTSSSMAVGRDQIPESLLPLLGARLFVSLSLLDVLVGMAIFFTGELILSRILSQFARPRFLGHRPLA